MSSIKSIIQFSTFICTFIWMVSIFAAAESGNVLAKVDTNQIRIGEQIKLEFNAPILPNQELYFPTLPDTFNHFEVVKRNKLDTIPNSSPITLRQTLFLTSFDSGYYVIPPIPFLRRNIKTNQTDTILTQAILIGVKTIAVDTTKAIKDIKPVMTAPYPWREYLPYILGAIIIIGGIIYLALRLARRRKRPETIISKPKIPAHILALENLKRIESEKIWQNGFMKKYHSEVSDTLRTYIEERFSIPAMEQPSDETLRKFGSSMLNPQQKERLKFVLHTADLVKFAKSEPVSYENEQSMQYALEFVRSTSIENSIEDNNTIVKEEKS